MLRVLAACVNVFQHCVAYLRTLKTSQARHAPYQTLIK